jgi:hypothetical protein
MSEEQPLPFSEGTGHVAESDVMRDIERNREL